MKAIGFLILFAGLLWALYGAVVTPMMYDTRTASAPQQAQVNSEATRIASGGLATCLLGVGLIAGDAGDAKASDDDV